jgi:hypothetical protein
VIQIVEDFIEGFFAGFREVGSWHFACPSAFVKMKRAHPLWNAPA